MGYTWIYPNHITHETIVDLISRCFARLQARFFDCPAEAQRIALTRPGPKHGHCWPGCAQEREHPGLHVNMLVTCLFSHDECGEQMCRCFCLLTFSLLQPERIGIPIQSLSSHK